jgi:hypothetical protein
MVGTPPLPGRVKPTYRTAKRWQYGPWADWRFPKRKLQVAEDAPGLLLCPRCHAISQIKRWFLDEALYQQYRTDPRALFVVCPGCEKIERGIYEGRILLLSPWHKTPKEHVLGLVRNEERRVWESNPLARIASIEDRGTEVEIITTNQFLAKRIGLEVRKAYHGRLRIDDLAYERFVRVWWYGE